LVESAIIYTRQIFTTGREGDKIAGNDSNEINKIRLEILTNVENELAWGGTCFKEFYGELRDQRNRFIAHYDGQFANFQEKGGSVSTIAAPGMRMNREEINMFVEFVKALRRAIITYLRGLSKE
jgi:hypothetical protein